MPIQISPGLAQALADRVARLTAETAELTAAKADKQGNIDGTTGLAPGLQKEEDVNEDLFTQQEALIALFETEREAIDGVFASPAITSANIEDAAKGIRPAGGLFPVTNLTLDPIRVPALDGTGGNNPVNEVAEKVNELAAIAALLALAPGARPGSAAETNWINALTAQSTLLGTQITAATANTDFYGPSHPAVTAATSEKSAIDALLPSPALDNGTLNARDTQAMARQGTLAARVMTIVNDVTPFYDDRFLTLRSRVNMARGTLTTLRSTEDTIVFIDDLIALNNATISYYNSVT